MGIEGLLEKSRQNLETGNFAEGKLFYDVAISRYYYAIFQKIIYISKKNGFYSESKDKSGSHISTIENFNKNISSKLDEEDVTKLSPIMKLKKLRVKADYGEECFKDKNMYTYNKCFFNMINEVLDRIIKGGGK